jgi:signal transduction histidine kinase
METLFQELKRYVGFDEGDGQALREIHPLAAPELERIATVFYDRILAHEGARAALIGGESRVGQLKITLRAWMDKLLSGPWDEEYYQMRARIGRVHVRIRLPQHYMFGAMNVIRRELSEVIDRHLMARPEQLRLARVALGKILDLELAIMLHTYREDLIAQQATQERLATFGQLVGSIGHELRNPLGVIESSLYILGARLGEDERAKKHVERIGEQLRVANGIISALLDMIRDRPIKREPVSLERTVASVLGSVVVPAGVRVTVTGFDSLPPAMGDAGQLRQVMLNLIENAVYAASPAGEVHVSAAERAGQLELAVEDSGPGVDPEIRKRLFEPLITTKAKGIGLGLALVRRIVERHGGRVVYRERDGGGARFVVTMPNEGPDA